MTALSKVLSENISYIESRLPVGTSFDFMTRRLLLGETPCYFIGINGFCKTEVLQQILAEMQNPLVSDSPVEDIVRYMDSRIGYAQASLADSWEDIVRSLLSGPAVLLVDGFAQGILIDVRTYPSRGVAEPESVAGMDCHMT